MIDTLKLSRRLIQVGFPEDQAIALTEGLDSAVKESFVTNEKLDIGVHTLSNDLKTEFRTEIAKIRSELSAQISGDLAKLKTELIFWIIGTIGTGLSLSHLWK